jgi:hypothetical protein
MTGNLSRRVQQLEGARQDKQKVYVFRRGPEDDAALDEAKRQADKDGKLLVILSWFDAQP